MTSLCSLHYHFFSYDENAPLAGVSLEIYLSFPDASENIRRCLVTGFFSQAAKFNYTGKYVTVKEEYPFNVYKGSTIMYSKDYPQW